MSNEESRSSFDWIAEVFSGIQIAAPSTILGFGLGYIFYKTIRTPFNLFLLILFGVVGTAVGVLIAIRISKREGTVNFMSKLRGTSELDQKDAQEIEKRD